MKETFVSYAQNFEDVVLGRIFDGATSGFYIDIGASDPDINSITRHFSLLGWSGINVDPHPLTYHNLCTSRPRDINLQVGVSDRAGILTYYEVLDSAADSTMSEFQARRLREEGRSIREHDVEVVTLASLFERYATGRVVDFLSVDVEGHEREVLSTVDFTRWRPRVLIIEATEPRTSIPSHHRWEDLVLSSGYLFTLFDGINRFYLRDEDREFAPRLSYPTNPLDRAISAREAELIRENSRYREFGRVAWFAAKAAQNVVNSLRRSFGRLPCSPRQLR